MINDTYEALLKKAIKAEGVGTDDDREQALPRNRQLGFDRPVDPVNVTESELDLRKLPHGTKVKFGCGCVGTRVPCPYRITSIEGRTMQEYPWFRVPHRQQGFECSLHPADRPATRWEPPDHAAKVMTEAAMRRPGSDPSNARAPRSPMLSSMSRPFRTARSTAGTQLQLRPRIRHGKFAIHGPGDIAPRFRFHNERIATIVAGLLDRHTGKKHSIQQSEPDIRPLQQ